MIAFNEAEINSLAIHRVGSKADNEYVILAEQTTNLSDENLRTLLKTFFLSPLQKTSEVFRLQTDGNEDTHIFNLATDIFEHQDRFLAHSKSFAQALYQLADQAKYKAGELYIAYFSGIQLEGEEHEAIGLFKSEQKETFLRLNPQQQGFELDYESNAINLHKLDRACLIFNTEKDAGYKVLATENGSKDTSLWKDDFLKLKVRNDNFQQTQAIIGLYKNFVSEKLDEEFEVERTDKIDLLNRSMKYFKEKDSFDMDEFANEVIANEQGIALFKDYKSAFEQEFDQNIADSFDISEAAVKKQSKVFKSILKLDKNFHVYIHGNKEFIVKEFDEEKGMNCYKLYFKEEA